MRRPRARNPVATSARTTGGLSPSRVWPRGRFTSAATDDDRRRASVIPDRHPLVVRQQRIVGPEHAAEVRGVLDRRIEVGVVADDRRREQSGLFDRQHDASCFARSRAIGPSVLRASLTTARSPRMAFRSSAMSALSVFSRQPASTRESSESSSPASSIAWRSAIRSPIATPMRDRSEPRCAKTPSGRF